MNKKRLIGEIVPQQGGQQTKNSTTPAYFKWPDAVTFSHCTQCGSWEEINMEKAIKLLKIVNQIKKIHDIKNFYIETSFCKYCKEREVKIEIKEYK